MQIQIEIPNDIAHQMQNQWRDLPQKLLEILAVEAYKADAITRGQIQQMLKLSSLYEVDGLLKRSGAYLHYDETDFEQDLLAMQKLKEASNLNS